MCDTRATFLGRMNHGDPGCELGDLANPVYRNRSGHIWSELPLFTVNILNIMEAPQRRNLVGKVKDPSVIPFSR